MPSGKGRKNKTRNPINIHMTENGDITWPIVQQEERGISRDTVGLLFEYRHRRKKEGNCVFRFYDTNDVLTLVKYRPAHTVGEEKWKA